MARANGAVENAREGLHEIEEMGRRAASRGAATARRASRAVHEVADDALDQATVARHDIEVAISNRPITSVLLAAGVGFLVAKLWR